MLARTPPALALTLLLLVAAPLAAQAARLTIGSGATLDLGSSRLMLGCADLTIAGALHLGIPGAATIEGARDVGGVGSLLGGVGHIQLAGDWSPSMSFATAGATIELTDGCGRDTSSVFGDNVFGQLRLVTTSGKRFDLESERTQSIVGPLVLQGEAGALAVIRSTTPGSVGFIDLGGARVAYANAVDVDDSAVLGGAISVDALSLIGTNTDNWVFDSGVSALPAGGLLIGVVGLLGLARARLAAR